MSISSISSQALFIQSGDIALNPQQMQKSDDAFMALFDKKKDDPATQLSEIVKDGVQGMMKWKVKKMEEEIAAKVMASKNLTVEQVMAMPDKERFAIQKQIMREVAEQLKEAMNQQMKKETNNELGMFNSSGSVDLTA